MKRNVMMCGLVVMAVGAAAMAELVSPIITYQGQLKSSGTPASGDFSMVFDLYDTPTDGTLIWSEAETVSVANGLFTQEVEFPESAFDGNERYLEVVVEGTPLSPRQRLAPAPYAMYALGPWYTLPGGELTYEGGNVGIGTSNPGNTFSVAGGITVDQGGANDGGLVSGLRFGGDIHGEGIASKKTPGGNQNGLDFYTSNTAKMSISNSGQVSIGSVGPESRLGVGGGIRARGGAPGAAGVQDNGYAFNGSGDNDSGMYSNGDGQVAFFTNNQERVSLNSVGHVGIGTTAPNRRLAVVGDTGGDDDVMLIQNNNANDGDGLQIQLATNGTNADAEWKWITFTGTNGTPVLGDIHGNWPNGVTYASVSSDFAEWLPAREAQESFEPGDVVGVFDGRISKQTAGASHVMAVSTAPVVLGNYRADRGEAGANAGFVGQVPVKVRGPVKAGQLIVADGSGEGVAIAVDGAQLSPAQAGAVVGRAWESSAEPGVKKVNCLIGLPGASGTLDRLAALERELAVRDARLMTLAQENEDLRARLERIEARMEEGTK